MINFNRYYFSIINIFVPFLCFGQVINCDSISEDSDWTWINGNVVHEIKSPGASGEDGDLYLEVEDGDGGNSWIRNETTFSGNWTIDYLGTCLCWDFKIFDDNQTNSSNNFLISGLKIFSGNWSNPTLSAIFTPAKTVNENDPWLQICASVDFCNNGQLPINSDGNWAMEIGDGCTDWENLLSTISGIAFYMEVVNWNGGGEVIGFDNICLGECKDFEDLCSADFDWMYNDCQVIFINQSTVTPWSDWLSWELYSNSGMNYTGTGTFNTQTHVFSSQVTDSIEVCLEMVDLTGCVSTSCHFVNVPINSSDDFLGNDLILCEEEYILSSESENTIWNYGTVSKNFKVKTTGIYHATIMDSNGCNRSDTIQIEFIDFNVYAPNVFSPNGDGVNDCFKPLLPADFLFREFSLSIFDRWGALVFKSPNMEDCWDGQFKGKRLNPGVFVWLLEGFNSNCNKFQTFQGSITLLN
jgi:gliding motility-associated-like protein